MVYRRKFSKEFKLDAVRRIQAGQSVAELSRALEVKPSELYRWCREREQFGERAFAGKWRPLAEANQVAKLERMIGQQALEIPDHLCHRILRRDRDHHVHMIRHQMPFFDPALLLLGQLTKDLAQMLPQLPVQRLAAALRDEFHAVFALPLGVT